MSIVQWTEEKQPDLARKKNNKNICHIWFNNFSNNNKINED